MIAPFVDAEWLSNHPETVLVDARSYVDGRSGREAYERGHLPGAVFVDMDRHLAAPPSAAAGRHPLPEAEVFAEGMREAGIADGATVVAYDDDRGVIASRLVWMLRRTDHEAALLDGGYLAWRGARETGITTRPRADFAAPTWPRDLLLDLDQLDDLLLLDARPRERYRGEIEPLDARPGHVPGAVNVPCRENTDDNGRLLPVQVLRQRLADAGITKDTAQWVSSCGSGVTACHTLLVAEHVGLPAGALYVGSWSQWSATDRPAETG